MKEKVLDTLFEHCSYRAYLDKPVEEEKLHQIIRAIQSAPNWVNIQHTSIVAIKDTTHRKKLAELCGGQKQIAQAPVFLVFCADYYKTALACKKYGQDLEEIIKNKDHLLVAAHEVGMSAQVWICGKCFLNLANTMRGKPNQAIQNFISSMPQNLLIYG